MLKNLIRSRNIKAVNTSTSILSHMSTSTNNTTKQPEWSVPVTADEAPVLKLYNTLTRTKVPFIPKSNDEVTWYSCGPTVYNSSHMGHARNYVTIDINRRILQDFFGYNIKFIQNVTDIDDKIILKARQEYLFDNFSKQYSTAKTIDSSLLAKAQEGFEKYVTKNIPSYDKTKDFQSWASSLDLKAEGLVNPKLPMHVKAATLANKAIGNASTISVEEFLDSVKDIVLPVLDAELGATVTDPEIFKATSSYWERQYDDDMAKLNVLPSTVTTRVSEYVPEIVEYVEKIIKSGYAYATADGSVYFNTAKFDNSSNHDYAKLQPWNKGDMALIEDGEGSLTTVTDSKVNASDFALWKSSKPGEPFWPSPWGNGRPGWHIECSVMASDFVGESMDIHSGGIDLAFPHHDNELAQSEAHYDCKQWVNYFLHTGHLHIEGQKMSKSLKNFITIDEALEKYSSRQLRLCFALVQWNSPLDFKESLLNEVRSIESSLNKFFSNVKALKNDYDHKLESGVVISKKFGKLEKELLESLKSTQKAVRVAFCDNLSTPVAVRSLVDLVASANTYISSVGSELRIDPLLQVVYYITKILRILGFQVSQDNLGWVDGSSSSDAGASVEDIAMPFVKVLSTFRDLVRKSAINKENYGVFLEATDKLRNKDLLALNVSLDDRNDGQGALIKFLNESEKQELYRQQEEKLKAEEKARKAKEARLAEEKAKLEKGKLQPSELFKTEENLKKFSEWDADGIPTKTTDGEEVSKSARKKLVKQYEQQKKAHEAYLKAQSN